MMQEAYKSQRIFVATELFYPEEAATAHYLTQIATKLSSKYDVEVVAGSPVYIIDENKTKDLPSNVHVTRLGGKKINKNNMAKRLIRAVTLSLRMKNFIAKNSRKEDKIVMVTNPALLALVLPKWCKRHGRKLTMIVHDVFPENAVAAGILKSSSPLYFLAKKLFDSCYRCVSKFIVCGNDMREVVREKLKGSYKEIAVIQNWGDTERIVPLEISDESRITIQFAGNVGRVQGFERVLAIIKRVENPLVHFVIRGNGAFIDSMSWSVASDYQNLTVQGAYSRSEENDVLNSCDLSLVSLDDSMYGLGVPSKTYNSMAAGKPILFLGPKNSEIYAMVKENGVGYAFDITDRDSIVSFLNGLTLESKKILRRMGMDARRCVETAYAKEKLLDLYLEKI